MKKIAGSILAVAMAFAACENNADIPSVDYSDLTVNMGSNSANDVYYKLADGTVKTVERNSWDIAFSVPLQTGTILINEGAGVELYPAGDTAHWDNIDANTIDGVLPYYNDESDWLKGAFNYTATGHPNYGWGTYHGGNPDHNVGGDSAYVIKLSDGSFRKFMMIAKYGANSGNVFRIADLDGNHQYTDTVITQSYYQKKHFVHYSIVDKTIVDVEPDMDQWDLLFTRYISKIQMGPSYMNYSFMGVLGNPNVKVAKVSAQDPEKYSQIPETFSTEANVIGFDWKISDENHVIHLVDSTSYFIQSVDGKTYQLYFTAYDGIAAGTIDIKVRKLE